MAHSALFDVAQFDESWFDTLVAEPVQTFTIVEDLTLDKYSLDWSVSLTQTVAISENLSALLDVLNVHVG